LSHAKLIAEISRTKLVENATTHYTKSSSSHNRTQNTSQHGGFFPQSPQNANIQDIPSQTVQSQSAFQKKDSVYDTSEMFSKAAKTIQNLKKKTPTFNRTDSDIRFTKHRPDNLELYQNTIKQIVNHPPHPHTLPHTLPHPHPSTSTIPTPTSLTGPHTPSHHPSIFKTPHSIDQKISLAKFQKNKESNSKYYLMHYSNSAKN
jgi:hypothetical protein